MHGASLLQKTDVSKILRGQSQQGLLLDICRQLCIMSKSIMINFGTCGAHGMLRGECVFLFVILMFSLHSHGHAMRHAQPSASLEARERAAAGVAPPLVGGTCFSIIVFSV